MESDRTGGIDRPSRRCYETGMDGSLTTFKRDVPSDARQVRSRNALSGALLALLEERPFDQLTIREISARAGTGYATFFRHYPTKEALLSDVAAEEIADLLERAATLLLAADSYKAALALCDYVAERRKLWNALLTGGAAGIVREEFVRQARELGDQVTLHGDWLPPDLGVQHGVGSTIDILSWWLGQEKEYSPAQIADILNRLVISPLVGNLGAVPGGNGRS
jgi:AcrR family transcriptional regulator